MTDLKDKLTQASEVYGDQIIVRSLVNLIPYVGGSIDIFLSSAGQKFVLKRIETFINELKREFSQLHETQINKDYLETEEGFDLIVKAFNSSSRTRQKEKLNLFAKIIKGASTKGKEYEEDEPEIFLKIVEELSVKEIRVAKYLYELKEIQKAHPDDENERKKWDGMTNDAAWLSKHYPEFDNDQLAFYLVRLEKTGLTKELVGSYLGYAGGQYLINPMFRRFMNFIGTF